MSVQQPPVKDLATTFARTAGAAFRDQAEYFRALPDDTWEGPTGCARWTMHDLAGHIVGEAIWFPHLVREVIEGIPPLPNELWDELKALPGREIGNRMLEGAQGLVPEVERATPEQLELKADLGFARLPLWQALGVGMIEAVLHNWDGRIGREPGAVIPTPWAQPAAGFLIGAAPMLARHEAAQQAAGRYLLDVADGIGPVTITVDDGNIAVERGQVGTPDVTIHLTADQYVRLLSGRFPLKDPIERHEVRVEGDGMRAERLNRIFAGINN